jgi:hypothetical protein
MRLKATLEVNIDIKEGESFEEANERLIQQLVDVVDDWINDNGITPCIKVVYSLEDHTIDDIRKLN